MSTIKSSAEHLTLNADGSGNDIKFQSNGTEVASISDGGVVTSTGMLIADSGTIGSASDTDAIQIASNGETSFTSGVKLADNKKIKFGSGEDLEIYHDGSNSFITEASGTGELYIRGTNIILKSGADNDDYIKCNENSDVKLYHSNTEKFATTSEGTQTTGVIASDSQFSDSVGGNLSLRMGNRWGFRVATSSNDEDLHLDRNLSGTPANCMTWNKTNGNVGIQSDAANYTFEIGNTSTKGWSVNLENNVCNLRFRASANDTQTHAYFMNGNGVVGKITTANSGTSFLTSSDYRLKENVDYDWDATTRLKQLKPCRFNFIADDTNTLVDGFIAHEVSSVVPEAISGAKDAMTTDENGDAIIDPQGIDQSKLVPLLVKTIQELEARITALEA